MREHNSTLCTKRQSFNMPLLRQIWRDPNRSTVRTSTTTADNLPADLSRRADIAIKQSGWEIANRDIVKIMTRLLWRKQCSNINFESKEIANRVRILCAG